MYHPFPISYAFLPTLKSSYIIFVYLSFALLYTGKRPLEIVFAMGSSNPNGRNIFNWQKNIVKEMLDLYTLKVNRLGTLNLKPYQSVVYGMTVYGDEAIPVVKIGQIQDTKQLGTFVDQLSWPGEGTSFEEGLVQAEKLFDESDNKNPRKVLVLFVNDRTDVDLSTLKELVDRLMAKGIELRVIAVGDRTDDSQINVLTDGSEDVVVKVTETERPTDVAERLRNVTAKSKFINKRL